MELLPGRVVVDQVQGARHAIGDEFPASLRTVEESFGRDDQLVLAGMEFTLPRKAVKRLINQTPARTSSWMYLEIRSLSSREENCFPITSES